MRDESGVLWTVTSPKKPKKKPSSLNGLSWTRWKNYSEIPKAA